MKPTGAGPGQARPKGVGVSTLPGVPGLTLGRRAVYHPPVVSRPGHGAHVDPPSGRECTRIAQEHVLEMSLTFRTSAAALRLRAAAPFGAADSGRSVPCAI